MTDRMQNFIKKVDDYIIKNELIGYGDGIVLGLSGGADSVCLLRVLCLLRDKYKLTIHAVHVNHGIRGNEAKRDEENVVFPVMLFMRIYRLLLSNGK